MESTDNTWQPEDAPRGDPTWIRVDFNRSARLRHLGVLQRAGAGPSRLIVRFGDSEEMAVADLDVGTDADWNVVDLGRVRTARRILVVVQTGEGRRGNGGVKEMVFYECK